MHYVKKLLIAGIVALHLFCSTTPPITGPSIEEGNPQIVAVIVDSLSQPVEGVYVTAYLSASVTDSINPPPSAEEIAFKETDVSGQCTFDSLKPGTYTLKATDISNNRSALTPRIFITDDTASNFNDTLTLRQPGGITGIVSRGGISGTHQSQNVNLRDAAIMVIIQEIEVAPELTTQDGRYDFSGLPAGTYTILYYATDGFFSARQTIDVATGEVTSADTIILTPVPRLLPPKGFSLTYDTASSLVHLSWQKLDFDSLRWYKIDRIDIEDIYSRQFTTIDTVAIDSIHTIPSETLLYYVVRSVDKAFNESDNAGPLTITIPEP